MWSNNQLHRTNDDQKHRKPMNLTAVMSQFFVGKGMHAIGSLGMDASNWQS
jgi:hypothetical protein